MTIATSAPSAVTISSPFPALDELLMARDLGDVAHTDALRHRAVVDAYRHHLANSVEYARLAASVAVEASEAPMSPDDVPLVPVTLFKRTSLLSAPTTPPSWCRSSGTLGARSRVGRDRATFDRLLAGVGAVLDLLPHADPDDVVVAHLGARPDGADSSTWIDYLAGLLELVYETQHIDLGLEDGGLGLIRAALDDHPHVVILGTPPDVARVCEAAGASPVQFRTDVTVITGGGWKGAEQRIDPAAFRTIVTTALGLADDDQIRDAYSMVELNTILLECEHHAKHVPRWLAVTVRDLATGRPVAPGERGQLGFIDPTATSYPGMILSEDVGTLSDGPCACGRSGRTLTVEARVKQSEARGCALERGVQP